ncbi:MULTISPECIES: DMT family transporter [Bacillus cereus group]|uniref:Membrane protein n=1 Tax=Bacillus thuringiensis TaxID=1428 RepID=A0A1C4E5K8_BACTU|nr:MULTISPECIES: DMT family transporter [Bacillus cereus group]MBE7099721.1 DMT family transporter [Bacillus cereus]MED3025698.1 DMT family transporter [Bacillus wiedmannii]OTY00905.1 EamA family transporter [Bacillus thuringiensis serovar wratislaviensis]OUB59164.1 EamA family transporter [Bacillus thuringiensis serovar sylvestriensis]SCC38795.1 Membrane protein [Bacillus thuringiensis]
MTIFMYIFCLIVWGLNFIAVKIQGTPVSLELSLTYRLVMTAFLFLILIWFLRPRGMPTKKDIPFIVIFGVFNFALSYLCLYYATILSSAAIVTLIFSLKVILTPIALRIFLKEKLHSRVFVGGILGVLGVCILIYPNLNNFQGFNDIKGIMVAILGTLLTAIGDASSARNASHKVNPIYANAIGFTVGSLLMGVVVLFQGQEFTFPTSFSYVFMLLYLTLFASFVAWLFYLKLVEKIGGAQSGYMVALFPVIGGIASVLIGESDPSLYLFVGCFSSCIGAAIALGFRAQKQESKLTLKKVN